MWGSWTIQGCGERRVSVLQGSRLTILQWMAWYPTHIAKRLESQGYKRRTWSLEKYGGRRGEASRRNWKEGGPDQNALYICMKCSKNELKDLKGIFWNQLQMHISRERRWDLSYKYAKEQWDVGREAEEFIPREPPMKIGCIKPLLSKKDVWAWVDPFLALGHVWQDCMFIGLSSLLDQQL